MLGMFVRRTRFGWLAVIVAAVPFAMFGDLRGQEQGVVDKTETYLSGQSVIPAFDGWYQQPDGSADMWFSYLNENWQEQVDVPIGPGNTVEPFGPDAGQPTHFLPRLNRWQFSVRVPKDWGTTKEVVWTLTTHGNTYKAYGTLKPDYFLDNYGMQREAGVELPPPDNKAPVIKIVGERQRSAKVGQPIILSAVTTDDGLPKMDATRRERVAFGLRMAWLVYRGAGRVTFDPRQFKTWEDPRGGSSWARGWLPPPVPPDNTWAVRATFSDPGTFVIRAHATDGLWYTNETVTVTVMP